MDNKIIEFFKTKVFPFFGRVSSFLWKNKFTILIGFGLFVFAWLYFSGRITKSILLKKLQKREAYISTLEDSIRKNEFYFHEQLNEIRKNDSLYFAKKDSVFLLNSDDIINNMRNRFSGWNRRRFEIKRLSYGTELPEIE